MIHRRDTETTEKWNCGFAARKNLRVLCVSVVKSFLALWRLGGSTFLSWGT